MIIKISFDKSFMYIILYQKLISLKKNITFVEMYLLVIVETIIISEFYQSIEL